MLAQFDSVIHPSPLARAKWYVIYLGTRLRKHPPDRTEVLNRDHLPFYCSPAANRGETVPSDIKGPFWMAPKVDSLEERLKRAGGRSGEGRVEFLAEMSQTTMIGKDTRWKK